MTDASREIKALIWDVDGVLVDTEQLHFEAWKKLLAEHGQSLTLDEYRPMIGRPGPENLAELCAKKNIAGDQGAMTQRRREIYRQLRQQGIPVIAENVALVKDFAQHFPQLTQVVASSTARKNLEENLKATGCVDLFRFALSYEDDPTMQRKPAPDLYLAAVKRLGLPASACLAFEDTEAGVKSANAAGVRVVALPSDLTAGQDFSTADLVMAPGGPRSAQAILDRMVIR